MNTIAVSTYRRPHFLALYLERLSKCKELPNYRVHFFVDTDYDPQVLEAIKQFEDTGVAGDVKTTIRPERKSACPAAYNIMDAYLVAADESDEYVITGEEDIHPSEDFLRVCDRAYHKFLKPYDKIFCLAHKVRNEMGKPGNPSLLIGDKHCTSPIVVSCKDINKYLRPHVEIPAFLANPVTYNSLHFPNATWPPQDHYDHDGMTERIIEANGLYALKPDQTRTNHVGFVGQGHKSMHPYHSPELSEFRPLSERIDEIRDIVVDTDKLQKALVKEKPGALGTENQWGLVAGSLEGHEWDDLELDLTRDKVEASTWIRDEENSFKVYVEGNSNEL